MGSSEINKYYKFVPTNILGNKNLIFSFPCKIGVKLFLIEFFYAIFRLNEFYFTLYFLYKGGGGKML